MGKYRTWAAERRSPFLVLACSVPRKDLSRLAAVISGPILAVVAVNSPICLAVMDLEYMLAKLTMLRFLVALQVFALVR